MKLLNIGSYMLLYDREGIEEAHTQDFLPFAVCAWTLLAFY